MKDIGITESSDAVSESDLRRVEKTMGIRFPAPLNAFLTRFNGGRPSADSNTYHVSREYKAFWSEYADSGSALIYLNLFLSLDEIRKATDEFHRWREDFPKYLLPVAYDLGGNYVCIDLREPSYGQILFWDHEMGSGGANPFSIANDFEQFVQGLTGDNQ